MQSKEGCQPLELAVSADKSLVPAMVNTDVNAGSLCRLPLLFLSPYSCLQLHSYACMQRVCQQMLEAAHTKEQDAGAFPSLKQFEGQHIVV